MIVSGERKVISKIAAHSGGLVSKTTSHFSMFTVPSEVRSLKVIKYTVDSIELEWRSPYYMAEFVSHYTVTYLPAGSVNVSAQVGGRMQRVKLRGLRQGTHYIIDVTPFTRRGVRGIKSASHKVQTATTSGTSAF